MAVKRKRKNKFFITLGIAVVIIAAVTFLGHQLLFNSIDQEEKDAISEEVDKITQAIVDEIESDDQNQPEGETVSENEGNANSAKDGEISRIIASYENGFERLKGEGNSIVDRMITEVKEEYRAMKSSGGGKVDLTKLATAYTNRSKAYEDGLDSTLDVLIVRMEGDLKAAGMDKEKIQDYISRIKTEYKEQKDERRKLLLDKAKEYL